MPEIRDPTEMQHRFLTSDPYPEPVEGWRPTSGSPVHGVVSPDLRKRAPTPPFHGLVSPKDVSHHRGAENPHLLTLPPGEGISGSPPCYPLPPREAPRTARPCGRMRGLRSKGAQLGSFPPQPAPLAPWARFAGFRKRPPLPPVHGVVSPELRNFRWPPPVQGVVCLKKKSAGRGACR